MKKIPEFTNKTLKKIVNVYQLECTNAKSVGLGDYLRGCFCILQLAKLLNIEFDIDISNHPISKYIKNVTPVEGVDYNNIEFYMKNNSNNRQYIIPQGKLNVSDDFLQNIIIWFNSQNTKVFGFFSNAFPFFNEFKPESIEFIKSKFQPTPFMESYVEQSLKQMDLSFDQPYEIIHIRTGDRHLVENFVMTKSFMERIKQIVQTFIEPNKHYLILSDANILKYYLKTIPNFHVLIKNIAHVGGEGIKTTDDNGVMNTMLDFFLMSHSQAIFSLSVYDHISGFSQYCAILHGIPFKFALI